jgi:molybdopterin synthase catalytic subunit
MEKLFKENFSAWEFFAAAEKHFGVHGACNTFIGTMRDFRDGSSSKIVAMDLVHYPGMCEKILADLSAEANAKFSLHGAAIAHRIGKVFPGDTLVAILCSADHRAESFAAVHFLIETLKSQAPFWKKEWYADGQSLWVDKNTPGYAWPESTAATITKP